MTKETISKDKRDNLPFINFRPHCGLNFQDRLCWSLLIYRRRNGYGCSEHELVTRTHLSRKGVHAALSRLTAKKMVYQRVQRHYARMPEQQVAVLKNASGGDKWYKRFAFWNCQIVGKPVEDVLLGLLVSLAKGRQVLYGQSDAGLASLLGVHAKTVGRTLARMEERGQVRLVRHSLRYDVRLVATDIPLPQTGSPINDPPFEREYHLLRDFLVPKKMLEKEIKPLVNQVAASDQSFGSVRFQQLIEEAVEQHSRTGTSPHPGHLVLHRLQQILSAEIDIGAKIAEARYERHMVETDARCQAAQNYWMVIGHLGRIDHIECCGSQMKLTSGLEMVCPNANQTRIASTVKEALPEVKVIPKQYRLRCYHCGVTHDCLTVDVFATIDGWSSFRHIPASQEKFVVSTSKVTVNTDTSYPGTILVPGSRSIPFSCGHNEVDEGFLSLLDALEMETGCFTEVPSPEKSTVTEEGRLMPEGLSDDLHNRRHNNDLEMLRPVLVAALKKDEDHEDQGNDEAIFEN